MDSKLILMALALLAGSLRAELIPAARLTDWTPGTSVGVIGGIPNRTSIINATLSPYFADNTGATNAAAAIQAAIDAAGMDQVVFLPAGTYRCDSSIRLKSNMSLRGAGMDATILASTATIGNPFIVVGNGSTAFYEPVNGQRVTGGKAKGSTTITVADASPYTVGWMIQIMRKNSIIQTEDPLITIVGPNLNDGFGYAMRHKGIVTSKTATTVSFFPPLNFSFEGGDMNPTLQQSAYLPPTRVGLEDLKVDLTAFAPTSGITFTETQNSWIKNVKVEDCLNYGISIADSVNIEIRHCYVTKSALPPGSNQAGLLMGGMTNSLIEDNIVIDNQPGIEVNNCDGNVFAYNFWDSPTLNTLSIDTNHGPHPYMNLYEGNVGRHIMSDGYFGSNGYDIIFRNWFTGYKTGLTGDNDVTFVLTLKRFAHQFTIIGNVFGFFGSTWSAGFDGTSFGKPNIGNGSSSGFAPPWADWMVNPGPGPGGFQELDTAVESTLIRKGNWSYFSSSQESTGGDSIPSSLFRSSKPAWFGSLNWPPVNPAAPGSLTRDQIAQIIPAGYRYINGVDPPTGPDTTPPTMSPAAVNTAGTQITLNFNEVCQFGSGGNGGVALTASGGAVTVALPSSFSGSSVTGSLSRTIAPTETLSLNYTQPGNGIEDSAGNDLATVTGVTVVNGSAPPHIDSASINSAGTQLTMNFSEACQFGGGGSGGVTLTASGGALTVTLPSTISGSTIIGSLSRVVSVGETVSLGYAQPGNGIEDTTGNDLASVIGVPVSNGSTVPIGGGSGGGTISSDTATIQTLNVNGP